MKVTSSSGSGVVVWKQKQELRGEVWGSEELGLKLRGGEKEEDEAGGSETKSPSTGTCCCPVPISQMEKLSLKEFLTEETRNRDAVEWFSHSAMGTRACSQPVSKPSRTGQREKPGSIPAFCHCGLLVRLGPCHLSPTTFAVLPASWPTSLSDSVSTCDWGIRRESKSICTSKIFP